MDQDRYFRLFEKVAQSLVPNARAPQQVIYQKGPTTFDFTKEQPTGAPVPAAAKSVPKPKPAVPAPGGRDEVDDMFGPATPKINIR